MTEDLPQCVLQDFVPFEAATLYTFEYFYILLSTLYQKPKINYGTSYIFP